MIQVGDYVMRRGWTLDAENPNGYEVAEVDDKAIVLLHNGDRYLYSLKDAPIREWIVIKGAHTPADLAMALELAGLVDVEGRGGELDENGHPIFNDCGPGCLVCTADWLRAEVIAALRGER